MPVNVYTVALMALGTAIATGFGALPLLAAPALSRHRVALANALATGLMPAASLLLLQEGMLHDRWLLGAGLLLGVVFVAVSGKLLDGHEDLYIGSLRGRAAGKALLVIGVMTVHSASEGIGVGVSYGGGDQLGLFITAAIAAHNIPEGLAIALVMVPRGSSVGQAFRWSVFSSLPQPLLAVPAFLAVATFEPLLPLGLGFAAGAMIWMALSELLPEALGHASRQEVAGVVALSMGGVVLFKVFLTA
jgi:zinc transporter ZupT